MTTFGEKIVTNSCQYQPVNGMTDEQQFLSDASESDQQKITNKCQKKLMVNEKIQIEDSDPMSPKTLGRSHIFDSYIKTDLKNILIR